MLRDVSHLCLSVDTGFVLSYFKPKCFFAQVDLAGSESLGKTGTTGEGAKEGANINLSLLYLGQVYKPFWSTRRRPAPPKQKLWPYGNCAQKPKTSWQTAANGPTIDGVAG